LGGLIIYILKLYVIIMWEKLQLPHIMPPHNITFDACSEKKNILWPSKSLNYLSIQTHFLLLFFKNKIGSNFNFIY